MPTIQGPFKMGRGEKALDELRELFPLKDAPEPYKRVEKKESKKRSKKKVN